MEKSLIQLSRSELVKKINELKIIQEVLKTGEFAFYSANLKAEYNKCVGNTVAEPSEIQEGKYYFSDTLFDSEKTRIDVGPTLFLCKKIQNVKVYDGEGLFGRKKHHMCKQAVFTKIWETRKDTKLGYDVNNLLDFSQQIDIVFGREKVQASLYSRHFDPIDGHYYDNVDNLYLTNKKAADAFYQKYLAHEKEIFAGQAEEYKKLIYISLKLKELEEELANKERNQVVSSISVDNDELAILQNKHKIR